MKSLTETELLNAVGNNLLVEFSYVPNTLPIFLLWKHASSWEFTNSQTSDEIITHWSHKNIHNWG